MYKVLTEQSPTSMKIWRTPSTLSQISYSLVVILELSGVSEVQYKKIMIIDE